MAIIAFLLSPILGWIVGSLFMVLSSPLWIGTLDPMLQIGSFVMSYIYMIIGILAAISLKREHKPLQDYIYWGVMIGAFGSIPGLPFIDSDSTIEVLMLCIMGMLYGSLISAFTYMFMNLTITK
ncbi:MAG: hypothetical protein VXW91_05720 [Pseudomonadota bacterium]|nr:hypothetical protein [Pseudomonadota bacterium]MEC8664019.1 hypothetical protein [Pseudomonadota bacterium]